jgi:hypothetical protein
MATTRNSQTVTRLTPHMAGPCRLRNIFPPFRWGPDSGQRSEISSGATPATTNDDVPPIRRLANLSSPAPTGASAPPPLLGIFSGKPSRDYPVRPSIFETPDPSPAEDEDNELVRRWKAALDL